MELYGIEWYCMVLHGIDPHSNANLTTHITTNAPQKYQTQYYKMAPLETTSDTEVLLKNDQMASF